MYLQQLPSKLWRAQVKHGQRRRWTPAVPTRAEALRLGAELILELGGTNDTHKLTVAELVAIALNHHADEWSPLYLADMTSTADRLPAVFAARRCYDVTPSVVAALHRQLRKEERTAHSVRRTHALLSSAWSTGRKLELVGDNPCAKVQPPPLPERDVTAPTEDDVRRLLYAATGLDGLALRLAATAGVRRGELAAMAWTDVDLDSAVWTVHRSLVVVPGSPQRVERPTKTGRKGLRRLALDLPTVAALQRHRLAQAEQALAAGHTPVWVFSDDAGHTPWRPDRITRVLAQVRRRAGVTGVRLHDLRHYVATTMLYDGEHPAEVAAQLGHASISTTLRTYAHYLPGRGRESVERRAARLDGAG